jgi:hypothetical protein
VIFSGAAQAATVYSADFDTGSLGTNVTTSGNPPTVTAELERLGSHSMRVYLNRATSAVSYRTEISTGGREKVTPGQDYWYGFSIFLPNSYVPDNIWEIVAQWHNVPDTDLGETNTRLNPPLGLHTEGGKWMINLKWDTRQITTNDSYEGQKNVDLGPYDTGKWTDWVFHIKWSPFSDGFLQVWRDGTKVLDRQGGVGYNDHVGPYFKMGLYKGWKSRTTPVGTVSERLLYHDQLRIAGPGSSYADVSASANTSPAPKPPTGIVIDTN